MNIITDKCPDSVELSGHFLYHKNDFMTCFQIVCAFDKSSIKGEQINDKLMEYFLKDFYITHVPNTVIEEAYSYMINFLYPPKEDVEKSSESGSNRRSTPVFSYYYDSKYIYSAFMQIYGIKLSENTLNWWEFSTLFEGLPSGTKLSDIIGIRSEKLPTGKNSASRRASLIRKKEIFAIPFVDPHVEALKNALESL